MKCIRGELGFSAISDSYVKELMEVPEFYEKSEDVPEALRGQRRRAELFEEDHPEVQDYLKSQDAALTQEKKLAELRSEAKAVLAKATGLTAEQIQILSP